MWAPYFDYVTAHVDSCDSPFETRHALYALVEVKRTDTEEDNARLETLLSEAFDESPELESGLGLQTCDNPASRAVYRPEAHDLCGILRSLSKTN